MASFASALQEQCLYGIDDDAFANFPAHSIYPPPFATDAPAGPFAAWAAQVQDTRMRQGDSSKRIFDHGARVPMPPLKSYQVQKEGAWWRSVMLTMLAFRYIHKSLVFPRRICV